MERLLKRFIYALLALFAITGSVAAIEYFGGQPMGLFTGVRPANLGFNAKIFAAPSWKPNCVSSTVEKTDEKHFIAPLVFSGSAGQAWNKLVNIVKDTPRTQVVKEDANYLYAEFKSAGLGYVDDVEFALDETAGAIQVRSASRLGVRDFGVNRARVEAIRVQFDK